MAFSNALVSQIFNEIADLLELQGANPFRIRAYRNAARTVEALSQNLSDMLLQEQDFTELPGIGKDLALKIDEIIKTGKASFLEDLHKNTPKDLSRLMKISGLGAKKIKAIHNQLGIQTLDELENAAKNNQIRDLPGFGVKTEQNILDGIKRVRSGEERLRLDIAEKMIDPFLNYLKKEKSIKKIDVAGSNRRKKDTVKDFDILVICDDPGRVMEYFTSYENVHLVISKGETRSSVLLDSGLQVDLRIVPQDSYGAALHYFTGSKAHNIAIRKIGLKQNLKINEYGVFDKEKKLGGKEENDIFEQIGLPYIEPELRENRGEIEAAKNGALPLLVNLQDIKGDLHTHTNLTDGRNSLEEMIEAAMLKGYLYLGITEHSQHVTIAKGLDEKALGKRVEEIREINEKSGFPVTVLCGIEVDILEDGKLDLPDFILKELDYTVCSVHYKFKLSKEKQTERILRAMDCPYFNIWGHPTGRLINERDPYEVDLERIMIHAKQNKCILEINSYPDRLDLNEIHCKQAKEIGVFLAISTDAHSTLHLDYMRYGINQARRGWVEAKDVVNTFSLKKLRECFKRH